MKPTELKLVPEAAQIGRDIRVVGNDAGEQLSILAGTIARLDRQAPNYGRGNYNDFNTFYLQAASGTSGGSSGSPVVDIEGRVVALNAGANTQASSSFFLPLDRVQVALTRIQTSQPVPRGTLETEFVHKPFAELRRLGLARATEARVRAAYPNQTGLLVVEQVIPESPASDKLEAGDILVEVDGKLIAEFVPLAVQLDAAVGKQVKVAIERGGSRIEHTLPVDDLHKITPDEYIEYGDGVFHKLSYQQARHIYRPMQGVYVANPGYVFGKAAIPRGSIVTGVGSESIKDLDDLQRALEAIPDDQQAPVRFVSFDEPQSERQRIINNDRSWFPAQRCRRDDALGEWPCKDLAASPPKEPQPPSEGTTFPRQGEKHVQAISPSLVLVNFDMPYTVSGRRGPLLLRHGHHRRRRARLGGRRPQYGARRDGRRAAHVRGLARDPGARRVHPPAAQSCGGVVRPEGDRQHAGQGRDLRHDEPRAGAGRRRRGLGAGLQDAVAVERGRERRGCELPAVAHAALPRDEPRRRHARERAGRFRRHDRRRVRAACSGCGPASRTRRAATSRK